MQGKTVAASGKEARENAKGRTNNTIVTNPRIITVKPKARRGAKNQQILLVSDSVEVVTRDKQNTALFPEHNNIAWRNSENFRKLHSRTFYPLRPLSTHVTQLLL